MDEFKLPLERIGRPYKVFLVVKRSFAKSFYERRGDAPGVGLGLEVGGVCG